MIRMAMIASITLAGFLSPAIAGTTGILSLYKITDKGSLATAEAKLANRLRMQGCSIQLAGTILAEDGNIDLFTPDRFLYLECQSAVLGSKNRQTVFEPLIQLSSDTAFFEGALLPVKQTVSADTGQRSYILKISHYNNLDPAQRDRDLTAIGESLEGRADIYTNQADISVSEAYGARTPDEAVIIYYDSPEAGERFRAANKPILKKIGAFNKNHLEDYVYYVAKPD
ncbi:MAG: hypothetical protein ABJN40_15360 [Sneathiella sp.]